MKNPVRLIDLPNDHLATLLRDYQWANHEDDTLTLEYSFFTVDAVQSGQDLGYDIANEDRDHPYRSGYRSFTDTEMSITRRIFQEIESLADIRFEEVVSLDTSDLRLGITTLGGDGSAFAPRAQNQPVTLDTEVLHDASPRSGDVWISSDVREILFTQTLIHEIGHALGLSHPFEDSYDLLDSQGFDSLPRDLDYVRYSVMSYDLVPDSVPYAELLSQGTVATLMPLDVEALQYLYGARDQSGDDQYYLGNDVGFSSLPLDGNATLHEYRNGYAAIFDGRGINSLAVDIDDDLVIDLRADNWSNTRGGYLAINSEDENLYLGPETRINKLQAAGGDDTVTGSDIDHIIELGDGDDRYIFTGGVDQLDGGEGFDVADLGQWPFSWFRLRETDTDSLVLSQNNGDAEITLINIERLVFSDSAFSPATAREQISLLNQSLLLSDFDEPSWQADILGAQGEEISNEAARLYRLYYGGLGRAPDQGGFDWWLDTIRSGTFGFEEVAARFVDAPEFRELADVNSDQEVSDEEFLDHMYQNVFGRSPDQEGFDWWLNQLDSAAVTQEAAFARMVESDEFVLLTAGTVSDYLFL